MQMYVICSPGFTLIEASKLIRSHCYSFSTANSGPVYFLDILEDAAEIKDVLAGTVVASAPLSSFLNRSLLHTMTVRERYFFASFPFLISWLRSQVKYGPSGSITYAVTDSQTGASILSFSKTGAVGGDGT